MDRDERQQLRETFDEVGRWVDQARGVLAHRASVERAGREAVAELRRRLAEVRLEGRVQWRVLPLRPDDSRSLSDVAGQASLPRITAQEHKAIDGLTRDAAAALLDAKAVVGVRRFFSGSKKRETATTAARFLTHFRDWAESAGVPQLLERLSRQERVGRAEVSVADALGLAP